MNGEGGKGCIYGGEEGGEIVYTAGWEAWMEGRMGRLDGLDTRYIHKPIGSGAVHISLVIRMGQEHWIRYKFHQH